MIVEITTCGACGEEIGFDWSLGYMERDIFGNPDSWKPADVGEFRLSGLCHAQCGIDAGEELA